MDRQQVSRGVLPSHSTSPHFLHDMPEVLICHSWLFVGIKGQDKNKTMNFNFISESLLHRSTLSKLISPNEVGAAFSLVWILFLFNILLILINFLI